MPRFNLNGTKGDGEITLFVGLYLVLLAVPELTGSGNVRTITVIVGVIAASIGVYEVVNLNDRLWQVGSGFAPASVGVGLYAVAGGGVLATVGGLSTR